MIHGSSCSTTNTTGKLSARDALEVAQFHEFIKLHTEVPSFLAYWAVYGVEPMQEDEAVEPGSCREMLFLDPEDKPKKLIERRPRSFPQVLDLTSR